MQFDVSWLAILTAGFSAVGIVTSIVFNTIQTKKNNDTRIIQLMRDFDHEISEKWDLLLNTKAKSEVVKHSFDYLNVLERLGYLVNTGRALGDLVEFFEFYYINAKDILENIHEVKHSQTDGVWKEIYQVLDKLHIGNISENNHCDPVNLYNQVLPREN